MKANVLTLAGKIKEKIELPHVFDTEYRPDLISRAVLSSITNRLQPKGTDPMAGKKGSVHMFGKGLGQSRTPRMTTGPRRAGFVPQAVGGHLAHPPKTEKRVQEKINRKERKLAIHSAIAASAKKELVGKRGHLIEEVKHIPLILEDEIETVTKTKEIQEIFKAIGVWPDVLKSKDRKIKAGRGKMRGRKYRERKGPLLVVSNASHLFGARNMAGVDVVSIKKLGAEHLAPGACAGRLVIWSRSAIEILGEA
jgi:large subunit ribosomal protein L4e